MPAAALAGAALANEVQDDAAHDLADVGEEGRSALREDRTTFGELQEALVDDCRRIELVAIGQRAQPSVREALQVGVQRGEQLLRTWCSVHRDLSQLVSRHRVSYQWRRIA